MASRPPQLGVKVEEVPIGNCGDPLRYPVPKEDGDLWDKLLKPLQERDKQQCDAWKDEVQNLLIFAGLFSAVITAFVVDSYKGLQPDPNQTVIALLSRIAASLDSPRNSTSGAVLPIQPLTSQSLNSSSSAISRVNTFWFISLVLSLTVVLVGTVALQWIREHQRYPVQGTPRDDFAIFNMRREGLAAWYVPHIFLALPMLLQTSLVLFLFGLIDFLVSIAPAKVFAPVIAFISLPIIFIVWTTIRPSFQWILPPRMFCQFNKDIPSQCPYKSPQSSAFTEILAPAILFICDHILHFLCARLRVVMVYGPYCLIAAWRDKLAEFHNHPSSFPPDRIALFYRENCYEEKHLHTWHETVPPSIVNSETLFSFLRTGKHSPIYDWIVGLQFANAESNQQLSVQEACYHCVQELEVTTVKGDFAEHAAWCQYIRTMLWRPVIQDRLRLMNMLSYSYLDESDAVASNVLHEELSVTILQSFNWFPAAMQEWAPSSQIHEFYIRLMKYYLPKVIHAPITNLDNTARLRPGPDGDCFINSYWLIKQIAPHAISEQYTVLLEEVILSASSIPPVHTDEDAPDRAFPMFPAVIEFVKTAGQSQDLSGQLRTLQFMKTQAEKYFLTETSSDSPGYPLYLFIFMALYVGDIINRSRDFRPFPPFIVGAEVTSAVTDLFVLLAQWKDRDTTSQLQMPPNSGDAYEDYSAFVDEFEKHSRPSGPLGHTPRGSQLSIHPESIHNSPDNPTLPAFPPGFIQQQSSPGEDMCPGLQTSSAEEAKGVPEGVK